THRVRIMRISALLSVAVERSRRAWPARSTATSTSAASRGRTPSAARCGNDIIIRVSSDSGARGALSVVLFSGGRGSGALTRQLVARPGVSLTVAINGYDDGASTGEVRRFLGDSLGPSDFRKNASRLAGELHTSGPELIALLDARLPAGIASAEAVAQITRTADDPASHGRVRDWLTAFVEEHTRSGTPFAFGDCSVGNL